MTTQNFLLDKAAKLIRNLRTLQILNEDDTVQARYFKNTFYLEINLWDSSDDDSLMNTIEEAVKREFAVENITKLLVTDDQVLCNVKLK